MCIVSLVGGESNSWSGIHSGRNLLGQYNTNLAQSLAHSCELIEANDGRGLNIWSEGGIEANNKRLRMYRQKLSRKTGQMANLEDCFKWLWLGSDLVVREQRIKGQTFYKMCGQRGHSLRSCVKVRSCDKLLVPFFVKDWIKILFFCKFFYLPLDMHEIMLLSNVQFLYKIL